MIGLKPLIDLLTAWAADVQSQVSLPEWWPGPVVPAIGALVLGLVLALWGSRLLRLICVLVFIAVGAAAGVAVARSTGVDPLIGLVLGAGVAGLVGHLLYRWWVGVTAACCAALLVLAVAAVRNLPDVQASMKEFHEQRGRAITSSLPAEAAAVSAEGGDPRSTVRVLVAAARSYVSEAFSYFRQKRADVVYRVAVVAALAWFTGLGMGLTLPRFTTIVGTSLAGVLLMAAGLLVLAGKHAPAALEAAESHENWFLSVCGVILFVSLIVQARHRRPAPAAAPVAPAPPQKAG